jgi:biotin transport system substrate-specific component
MARPASTFYSLSAMPAATIVDALTARANSRAVHYGIRAAATLFMAVLTAAAAQVSFSIPFTTVPLTLQPMVVLMSGLALGPRLGLASQVLYLAAGIAGLPVFAFSPVLPPGAARLIGPTGGYLMSYPFAAMLTGYLAERGLDRRYLTSVLAMIIGLIVIYLCGAAWLGLFVRTSTTAPIGFGAALAAGVYPFVGADLVKLLFAAAVMPLLWRLVRIP